MKHRQVEHVVSESSGSRVETCHLYAAYVPENEFDLDEAVDLASGWSSPNGADGVKVRKQYVIGRFEDRTMFAVITVPTYRCEGKLLESEEYFRRVNDPNDSAYWKNKVQ